MAFARAAGGSMSDTPSSVFAVKAERRPRKRPRRRPRPGWDSSLSRIGFAVRPRRTLAKQNLLSSTQAAVFGAPKSVPSRHMRCSTTAILRANPTRAFLNPARLASFAAQLLSGFDPRECVNMTVAAS
jgi:hypothetical protein